MGEREGASKMNRVRLPAREKGRRRNERKRVEEWEKANEREFDAHVILSTLISSF